MEENVQEPDIYILFLLHFPYLYYILIYFNGDQLKGQSAKFLSFNMLIGALDGALVQNLCPVPHFNPKL